MLIYRIIGFMNKKHAFIFFAFLIAALTANAQRKIQQIDDEKREQQEQEKDYGKTNFWDNVRFGGNFGGGLGAGSASLLLQPMAFYKVTDNFSTGLGVTYYYWSTTINYTNGTSLKLSDHSYGPNIFGRYTVFQNFAGYLEYNAMNFTSYNGFNQSKRVWNNALFLGPGYVQEIGRGGTYILVLYDVLWRADDFTDPNAYMRNVRPSPWDFRIGFYF